MGTVVTKSIRRKPPNLITGLPTTPTLSYGAAVGARKQRQFKLAQLERDACERIPMTERVRVATEAYRPSRCERTTFIRIDHVRLVKLSIVRDEAAHARPTRVRADKKQTTEPDIYKGSISSKPL